MLQAQAHSVLVNTSLEVIQASLRSVCRQRAHELKLAIVVLFCFKVFKTY